MNSLTKAASLLVALLLLSWAAIPGSIKSSARTAVIKTFFRCQYFVQDEDIKKSGHDADFNIPSRPEYKLLTEEEFITQGVVETKKALDQLKEYCRSPESKPWQTVRKLQSPVR